LHFVYPLANIWSVYLSKISFRKIPIPDNRESLPYFTVYYAYQDNRSVVADKFKSLSQDTKDDLIELIIRMARNVNYHSPKINWQLKGYTYGEVRHQYHRFFFFIIQRCLVFFGYASKKTNILNNKIYKLNQKFKDKY